VPRSEAEGELGSLGYIPNDGDLDPKRKLSSSHCLKLSELQVVV